MGQWSELPENLLHELDTRLVLYVDKVRIRSICVSWNSLLSKMPNHKERQFPWLLHALENSIEASHALFNPIDKKFYQLDLPEAQGKMFKGSSHGWVVTAEDKHSNSLSDIYLINPLTRARIKLPSRSNFPDVRNYRPDKRDQEYGLFIADNGDYLFYGSYCVNVSFTEKIVLSSTPSSNDCIAVAIYGNGSRLTYCKRNDKKWRRLALSSTRDSHFVDMIFRKGKLHALNFSGELVMFESIGTSTTSKVTIIAGELPRSRSLDVPYLKYLFECSDGSLIMVARYFNLLRRDDKGVPPIPCTNGFKVFKLDSNNSIWVEVKNIGGDMLFLGLSSSFSVSSHDFPEYKGNHIYFTDSHYSNYGDVNEQKDADIGVFNIEDATIQSLTGLNCHPKYFWPPPVWVNIS